MKRTAVAIHADLRAITATQQHCRPGSMPPRVNPVDLPPLALTPMWPHKNNPDACEPPGRSRGALAALSPAAKTIPGRVYYSGRDQGHAVTITSSGDGGSPSPDNARVRELLRAAGLSPRAAARELEIDEPAMRGYCTGKAVPRYMMLAIERLVDLRRMKVYHLTETQNAVEILAGGFHDGTGTNSSGSVHSGVWVSDQLLVFLSGIDLDDVACFEIKVLEEWLIRHESSEQGKGYRQFLVPAIELNDFPRRRLPDKEWRSMPWARG